MNTEHDKSKIIAIRNEEFKGVYTYEEYIDKGLDSVKGLRKSRFGKNQLEMANAWVNGICRTDFKNQSKGIDVVAESKNKLIGLKKLRSLLADKNIVTGYYDRCRHEEFDSNVFLYPCPWDKRVLYDGSQGVCKGCENTCFINPEEILKNKDVYIKCVDKLIANLEENPLWWKGYVFREGILDINRNQLKDGFETTNTYSTMEEVEPIIEQIQEDIKNGNNVEKRRFFQLGIQEILFYTKDISDEEAEKILEKHSTESKKWWENQDIYGLRNKNGDIYVWVKEIDKIVFEMNLNYQNHKKIARILANKFAIRDKTQYMYYIQSTLKNEFGGYAIISKDKTTKDYTKG